MDGFFLACLMGLCGIPAMPLAPIDTAPRLQAHQDEIRTSPPPAAPLVERPVRPREPPQGDKPAPSSDTPRPILADPAAGKLSRAALDEIVRRKWERVKHCYELGLTEDPRFSGTIEIGWKIQVDGRVSRVTVVGATASNRTIENCLLEEIPQWEFPVGPEPIAVGAYPFVFNASLLARHPAR